MDRYGNAITNLGKDLLAAGKVEWSVRFKSGKRCPVHSHYQAVLPGRAVAVPDSNELIEVAVNGGNASRRFGLKVGSKVSLVRLRRRAN